MESKLKLKVMIEFRLTSLADRVDLETKINNFIAGQAAGSSRRNQSREDPNDSQNPFWFRTHMDIVVPDVAAVASARSAIVTALETMPELIHFHLQMDEHGYPPAPEEPEEPLP
jgi:hypothetical protein